VLADADEVSADFGNFLRSAGKLAVARQVSALCLVGVVFVLPALTTRAISTDFVWAYFAVLTLTSLLGFGLERLAVTVAAGRGETPLARALAPILSFRLATAPIAAIGIWALFAFVGVSLPPSAWWATMLWVVAGLVGPVVFGGLRATGNSTVEPSVILGMRVAQTVTLVWLASTGATVTLLVAAMAAFEVLGVITAFHWVGRVSELWGGLTKWNRLPLRRGLGLAAIDVVALANLRADLLLVGHMMGAVLGATYGLLYRAVDGFNGVVGSAGLWLYAESSNERDGGTDRSGIRARSLAVLPRASLGVALIVVLGAGLAGLVVPRLSPEIDTLRILAVAFPLLTVNAVELHVRSGRGRNRAVLAVNSTTLAMNVPLCILLISEFGLPGAAAALVASELFQATLLWITASRDERRIVGPSLGTATAGGVALACTGAALGSGHPELAVLGAVVTGLLVAYGARRHFPRSAVAS
jgi:O-antigen/teichoic acid export membrane protein